MAPGGDEAEQALRFQDKAGIKLTEKKVHGVCRVYGVGEAADGADAFHNHRSSHDVDAVEVGGVAGEETDRFAGGHDRAGGVDE